MKYDVTLISVALVDSLYLNVAAHSIHIVYLLLTKLTLIPIMLANAVIPILFFWLPLKSPNCLSVRCPRAITLNRFGQLIIFT